MLKKPDEGILVGVDDGVMVGYLQYELIDGQPNNSCTPKSKRLHISTLTIRETHRRQGYGEALMDAPRNRPEFGAVRVTLERVDVHTQGAYRLTTRRRASACWSMLHVAGGCAKEEGHIS